MGENLERLVEAAEQGDQAALEAVVRGVQDQIHHLAMRILVNPEDAREATQEVLIQVVTKLSTFEGRSAFRTWVYRVAVNYLLSAKKLRDGDLGLTFEAFADDLHAGLVIDPTPSVEDQVLLNELRVSCTMAMLLCLDMKHRLAYTLGDILEFDHVEAAEVLGVSKANFRKRLSRARLKVTEFTSGYCGLANESARCSCPRRLPAAMALGRVRKGDPVFARSNAPSYRDVRERAKSLAGELQTLALQQSTPRFAAPEDFGAKIAGIVSGDT